MEPKKAPSIIDERRQSLTPGCQDKCSRCAE